MKSCNLGSWPRAPYANTVKRGRCKACVNEALQTNNFKTACFKNLDGVRKATLWQAKTSNRILPKVSPFVPLDYLQVMNKFEVLPIKTELALRDKKHRITAVNAEQVNFTYKDYRDGATTKTMTLRNKDFIQHFA